MNNISCFICKKHIDCKCIDESTKPKYKSCALTDGYPRSFLNFSCILIHLCSVNCSELYEKKEEETLSRIFSNKKNSK